MSEAVTGQEPPVVQVVRGRPDAHDVAALVAALAALRAAAPAPTVARPRPLWGAPVSLVRRGAGTVGWGGPSATVPR